MRIGIDLGPSSPEQIGGLSVLLRELVLSLGRLFPHHEYFVYGTEQHGADPYWPGRLTCLGQPGYLENVARRACQDEVDVLLRGYPLPAWTFPLDKQVVLIPDVLHEDHPEQFAAEILRARRLHFNQALTGAGALATISEFSRQRLLAQDNLLCRDIVVVPPGLPTLRGGEGVCGTPPALAGSSRLKGALPYFYFPANLWPHKNHRGVIEAFGRFLRATGEKCELVFSGHPQGWANLRRQFARVPMRHLGYVSREEVGELLAGARALVFFSLYEGFGMPVLEAFTAGTPVLCSNVASLPEVAGDAALSCDPHDVAAMAALMARIFREPDLGPELVRRGHERLRLFSWDDSARILEETLRRVADRPLESRLQAVRSDELVSIVTPSYNQGRFLRRTIDSVLSQDYPHIEYLVMDGGSRDDSVDILRSYGSRLRWVSEPDGGQSAAINKGLARSRGTIRAYLNSDDVLLPGAIAKAVEHFHQHPDWDLLYGRAHVIDEDDRVLDDYPTAEFSFARLLQDCCICQPAAFWRTRLARRVGPFDERLQFAMDYDYWMRLDRAGGQLRHVADFLASSRRHAQTKTLSARREVYREIFEVSLRHAGYAGPGHYVGYWRHLCRERPGGWPGRLGRWPGFVELMAQLHSRWHRSQCRPLPFCRDAARGLARKLLRRLAAYCS